MTNRKTTPKIIRILGSVFSVVGRPKNYERKIKKLIEK